MQSITNTNTNRTFEDACKVIDLRTEYGFSFVGDTPIAIVSDLDAEQIRKAFPKEIEAYPSFTLLTPAVYEVFSNFYKEEERVRVQNSAHPLIPIELAESVLIDPLGNIPIICESSIALEHIIGEMLDLPDQQGPRMYKRFILGYSPDEIAAAESVSKSAVWHSLQQGKSAIREVFIELGVAS